MGKIVHEVGGNEKQPVEAPDRLAALEAMIRAIESWAGGHDARLTIMLDRLTAIERSLAEMAGTPPEEEYEIPDEVMAAINAKCDQELLSGGKLISRFEWRDHPCHDGPNLRTLSGGLSPETRDDLRASWKATVGERTGSPPAPPKPDWREVWKRFEAEMKAAGSEATLTTNGKGGYMMQVFVTDDAPK